jgi:hypothetical protein
MTSHDRSPNVCDWHQAAVREPPAAPTDMQCNGADRTLMWPVASRPFGPPKSFTKRSRASIPPTVGHGWCGLHVPSISRAATPAIRTFGPSAHHIGPSPSQTAMGVHVKVRPLATMFIAAKIIRSQPRHHPDLSADHSLDHRRERERPQPLGPESNLRILVVRSKRRLQRHERASMTVHGGNGIRRFFDCCGSPQR